MPPSLRLALNTLASRPGRTALLGGAVALAAALVVAVSCGIGSAQASFDRLITKFIGAADARIVHPATERFDAALLDVVRAWPGVKFATGRDIHTVSLVRADMRVDPRTGLVLQVAPIAIAGDFAVERRIRDPELVDGRLPQGDAEILIDPLTAETLQATAGDRLVIPRFGKSSIEVTVSGIYHRDRLGTFQRPHIQVGPGLLAEITGRAGVISTIVIVCDDDVDVPAFCAQYGSELPAPLVLEPSDMVRTGFDQRVRGSRIALLVLSVLTFMACGFIIVIGLTTGMTERQREMAVLRCIGASRGQLLAQQLALGAAYGIFGAAIGVPLGLLLARVLVWIFAEYLPGGLHVNSLGVGLAAFGALTAGLLGALLPAVLASRVTPMSALAVAARPPRLRTIVGCAVGGLACIAVQMALYAVDDPDLRVRLYAIAGLPILSIGAFVLAVPAVVIIARLVSPLLAAALRLPRDIVRASIMTTPIRHGLTAGALMIGLAILVGSWADLRSLMSDWLQRIEFADGFAQRITGISQAEQDAIAGLDFVERTCPIGYFSIKLDKRVFGLDDITPRTVSCVTFNPPAFFAMNQVDWLEGDLADALPRLADGTGILVAEQFLTAQGIGAGDQLRLGVGEQWQDFEVVGVVSSAGLDLVTQLFGIRSRYLEYAVSCVFMDADAARRVYGADTVVMLQVDLAETITDELATARILEVAPGAMFRSGRWIRQTLGDIIAGLLMVQTTVAFGALVLAAIAVGNVLAAAIHGRRFEYGVLRAIGAERGVVVRLVLAESLLIGITASVCGACFGMYLAHVDANNLRSLLGLTLDPAIPWGVILIGTVVLLGLTVLASLPSVVRVVRRSPGELVATGRND